MQFDDDDFLIAIEKNNLTRLKKMYEAGARPQDIGRGVETPAHVAAGWGRLDILEWLHEIGCDMDAKDKRGLTPLYEALRSYELQIAELLLSYGAEVVPLSACESLGYDFERDCKICDLLLALGADINQSSDVGHTALMNACEYAPKQFVDYLIEKGADVNTWLKDSDPGSALQVAVWHDRLDIIRTLLDAGANPNLTDCDDDTPLFASQSLAAAEMLIAAGADPDSLNFLDMTAADFVDDPETKNFLFSKQKNRPK